MRFITISALALLTSCALAAPISNVVRDEELVQEVPDDECDAGGNQELQVPIGAAASSTTVTSSAAPTPVEFHHHSSTPIVSSTPIASPSPSPIATPTSSVASSSAAAASSSAAASAAPTGGASSGGGSGRASATNPAPVDGTGNMVVQNNCEHPIFLIDVQTSAGKMETVEANGMWSQPFALTASDGTGSVLKVWKEESQANNITQIEYSFADDGQVWYDISNLNGDPFAGVYNAIIPPMQSCQSVVCEAGVSPCTAAYLDPEDPKNYPCSSKENLIWEVCASS